MVASLILIKRLCKTKRAQDIAIIIAGGLLLVSIILNRIFITIHSDSWTYLIPKSFCGMTSLLLGIATLVFIRNHNHNVFHFLTYLAFLGGVVANFYPDYIGQAQSVFHSRTITGLLHHTLSVYVVVLLIITGRFAPTIKKWYCLPIGLMGYIVFGLFIIQAFGVNNAMLINAPLVAWLYWYVVGPLFIALQIIGLLIYTKIKNSKSTPQS